MNENEETDEETDEEQASCNRAAEAAANDESWSGSEEPEETAYIGEKQMVKIVVRKADGSEVEAEVPVLNAGVIRLDGELYSLDRMTTDRAMSVFEQTYEAIDGDSASSGKRTAYFVPAEILEL